MEKNIKTAITTQELVKMTSKLVCSVCKNFERNRPLVGANEIFWLSIHVVFHTCTQYAYQFIDLLMMHNFASRTIAVNQIIH